MNRRREIEGFALPFTVGIAASAGTTASITYRSIYASISLAVVFILSALLIRTACRTHSHAGRRHGTAIIAAIALACGIFTGFNDSVTVRTQDKFILKTAARAAENFEEKIGSIHFRHEQTGSLIKALLTGNRSGIPEEVKEAFTRSGASHILALSGLHLGIIYSMLSLIFRFPGCGRTMKHVRSCLIVITCGAYTFITGAGSSITRAFIFIVLGQAARMGSRCKESGQLLMSSLILQLTLSPSAIKSLSFQLSYLAIAGIVYIYPRIRDIWPGRQKGASWWLWKSAAMSISCQATTAALVWHHFGTFPVFFILTNMIAIPLTGLIVPLGMTASILEATVGCPQIVADLTETVVILLTEALKVIASS